MLTNLKLNIVHSTLPRNGREKMLVACNVRLITIQKRLLVVSVYQTTVNRQKKIILKKLLPIKVITSLWSVRSVTMILSNISLTEKLIKIRILISNN
jgi:hypothetical protein